jgi:hypothetical protein
MDAAMPGTTERAIAFLRERGAADVAHPGGALLAHVLRTRALAIELGASPALALAALCHAAYGTDGFAVPLLDPSERDRLRAVIGREAERLVYLYGACARRESYPRLADLPFVVSDRFTGGRHALDAEEATSFALLTIANEMDVLRSADLDASARASFHPLFRALARHAPAASSRALAELSGHG